MERGLGEAERKRVEAVVETLARLRSAGETVAEVAHDARNMVTALGLYCDLLEEPGVLSTPFLHYGSELRLVAAASHRLVEKLVALDTQEAPGEGLALSGLGNGMGSGTGAAPADSVAGIRPGGGSARKRNDRPMRWDMFPAEPIENLAVELLATRNLLAALAGPSIALTVDTEGAALPVWLTGEDLTRILVNLVKNAAEAMPAGGSIQLGLRERPAEPGAAPWLTLTIEDNGPGIPRKALDRVFESGYTTRASIAAASGGWSAGHRGLGLSITRSIVEGAGGLIRVTNRPKTGARFEIELPVRTR
jgi:signal transduction histidine kinase